MIRQAVGAISEADPAKSRADAMQSRPASLVAGLGHSRRRGRRERQQLLLGLPLVLALSMVSSVGRAGASRAGVFVTEVTRDPAYEWGEPQIAVNLKNPANLVYFVMGTGTTEACLDKAATDPKSDCALVSVPHFPLPLALGMLEHRPSSRRTSIYVSFDHGRTWKKSTDIPGKIPLFPPAIKGFGVAWDPMVAVGPDGTFYAAWDANHNAITGKVVPGYLPAPMIDYAGIPVSKSTDGGRTWSDPVFTGTAIDRPFLQVDQSTGRIYEASTGPVPGPTASGDPNTPYGTLDRYLVSSMDGVHWTTPRPMGIPFFGISQIAPAHGVLATAFKTSGGSEGMATDPASGGNNYLCGSAPTPCTMFQTTRDAGETWERHVIPIPNNYTGGLNLSLAADPAKAGHYAVGTFTNKDTAFTVYQTHDFGKTWNAGTTVTDDANKLHDHAWMTYSPNGVLGLMWKSRNSPPGGSTQVPMNVFAAISRDGGTTFSQPLKVNSTEYPAPDANPLARLGDDYSYLVMGPQDVYLAYATTGPRVAMFADIKLSAFKAKK